VPGPPKKHARYASSTSDSDAEGAEYVDEESAASSFWVVLDDIEKDNEADETEIDSDREAEIHNEGELLKFMAILQEAQVAVWIKEARNN